MNNTNLIGRLTANPELRTTTSNVEVCSFTLAVPRRFKTEGQPDADFINCVAFKNVAVTISKYVAKGERLAVMGRISTRNYENKEGNKIYVTEVIVENIDFLEPKKDNTNTEETDPFVEMGNKVEFDDSDFPF